MNKGNAKKINFFRKTLADCVKYRIRIKPSAGL